MSVVLFGVGFDEEAAAEIGLLAQRARDGDRAAYGELYRMLSPMVAAVARRTIADPDAVADVVQDTFVKALEHLHELRDLSRFSAWVAGIARNTAADALRTRYRMPATGTDELHLVRDTNPGPEDYAADGDELTGVLEGFGFLTPGDALAVALVAHLGLNTAELAVALGVAPNAAKVRLHRARRRLATVVRRN